MLEVGFLCNNKLIIVAKGIMLNPFFFVCLFFFVLINYSYKLFFCPYCRSIRTTKCISYFPFRSIRRITQFHENTREKKKIEKSSKSNCLSVSRVSTRTIRIHTVTLYDHEQVFLLQLSLPIINN